MMFLPDSVFLVMGCFYRPQGKVMFSEASVSHSVHRGQEVYLLDRDPRQTETPWTETPLDRDPPWTETPWDRDPPLDRHPPLDRLAATAAVNTHPTGMHSCCNGLFSHRVFSHGVFSHWQFWHGVFLHGVFSHGVFFAWGVFAWCDWQVAEL